MSATRRVPPQIWDNLSNRNNGHNRFSIHGTACRHCQALTLKTLKEKNVSMTLRRMRSQRMTESSALQKYASVNVQIAILQIVMKPLIQGVIILTGC